MTSRKLGGGGTNFCDTRCKIESRLSVKKGEGDQFGSNLRDVIYECP